ncbi:hypothetical protein BZG36_01561 [Bifiguratus adelaidae]|uniref:GOLD domain-containing protein n=1 Tax=Bifiguratus adelaidae TaxID=1938954 RepID=A0A261Y4C7_9FUNG|nr:hypothetical protein BZG36_01561 [Bifiguratus adelaidae]
MASAIKFDLPATLSVHPKRKCIHQYVPQDTMVLVLVKVSDGYNQRVGLEIFDNSLSANSYDKKRDLNGEVRLAFNTHADADISVCFTNTLHDGIQPDPKYSRVIDLEFEIGAEADDYQSLAKAEKLAPLEVELRKLEKVVQEIVDEMEYLKTREAKMRDTNESTNERVQWFSLLTLFTLIGLGTWQIFYLRRFFKRKRLID